MILCHARALAHATIYRLSEPLVLYSKDSNVPNPGADDWEPSEKIQEPPPAPLGDCGCGPLPPEQDDPSYD